MHSSRRAIAREAPGQAGDLGLDPRALLTVVTLLAYSSGCTPTPTLPIGDLSPRDAGELRSPSDASSEDAQAADARAADASTTLRDAGSSDARMPDAGACRRVRWSGLQPTRPPGERERDVSDLGVVIQAYPGDEVHVALARAFVEELACTSNPYFQRLLRRTHIVISPPGRGLEAVVELGEDFAQVEGVADYDESPFADGPSVAIRGDSLDRWNMGLGHEFVHLLVDEIGPTATARIMRVWEPFHRPASVGVLGADPEHLFVFMGQYDLAGYGPLVLEVAPDVHALTRDLIGDARVSARTTSEAEARALIARIVRLFKTGT